MWKESGQFSFPSRAALFAEEAKKTLGSSEKAYFVFGHDAKVTSTRCSYFYIFVIKVHSSHLSYWL